MEKTELQILLEFRQSQMIDVDFNVYEELKKKILTFISILGDSDQIGVIISLNSYWRIIHLMLQDLRQPDHIKDLFLHPEEVYVREVLPKYITIFTPTLSEGCNVAEVIHHLYTYHKREKGDLQVATLVSPQTQHIQFKTFFSPLDKKGNTVLVLATQTNKEYKTDVNLYYIFTEALNRMGEWSLMNKPELKGHLSQIHFAPNTVFLQPRDRYIQKEQLFESVTNIFWVSNCTHSMGWEAGTEHFVLTHKETSKSALLSINYVGQECPFILKPLPNLQKGSGQKSQFFRRQRRDQEETLELFENLLKQKEHKMFIPEPEQPRKHNPLLNDHALHQSLVYALPAVVHTEYMNKTEKIFQIEELLDAVYEDAQKKNVSTIHHLQSIIAFSALSEHVKLQLTLKPLHGKLWIWGVGYGETSQLI